MKKRRILALLLALSLSVNMNGMTVLATASDGADASLSAAADSSAAAGEADSVDGQETENAGAADKEEDRNGGDTDGGNGEGSGVEDTDREEGSVQENPGSPSQGEDVTDPDQPGETEPGEDTTDDPDGTKPGENDSELPDAEEPGQNDPAEDPDGAEQDEESDTSVSGNTVEEEDAEEELPDAAAQTVRMMTFTDETGMRITYNAAAKYNYTIDETGTLTGITNEDGSAVSGNVVLEENKGIKKISQGAFTGNTSVTYIRMPDGVTSIGENAFKGCTALKGMTIPTGVGTIETSAFEGCSGLTQFALPATVTGIGDRAFYGDARLFMVYMRNIGISELQSIGSHAFYGCSSLVEFSSDVKFTFPDSLVTIGEYAFYDCDSIKNIAFSKKISSIGVHAFESCGALTEVYLPDALAAISQYTFADCIQLVTVTFGTSNHTETIDSYAFKGCYNLRSIDFSNWVDRIASGAFENCSGLIRVQIPQPKCVLEERAFPDVKTLTGELTLIGHGGSDSSVQTYAILNGHKFSDLDAAADSYFYKWTSKVTGTGTGEIQVSMTTKENPVKDPNSENNGKGVTAGTDLYVRPMIRDLSKNKLVKGSLKCNGEVVSNINGEYTFKMPKGGAVITAEFEAVEKDAQIDGTDVTYELSNGDELKVGQTTRLFLLDANNKIISHSKISYKSDAPTVASITDQGMITALKEGNAHITVEVNGGNAGAKITKRILITVSKPDVASIRLWADNYNSNIVTVTDKMIGGQLVQTAAIDKMYVYNEPFSLDLKTQAYDKDSDAMAVALKWSTSDAKVAKLLKTTTNNADSDNKITIPKGASGEATITVTATNADKKTIRQKLIIQVKDYTPRLSASAITLNLAKEEGAVLRVISSYDGTIHPDTFRLVEADNDKVDSPDFTWEYDAAGSSSGIYRYIVRPKKDQIDARTYNVKVKLNSYDPVPLKITVQPASSIPKPKVAFDKKQQKINLFFANDGTEIKPVITKLGSERIERYSLEPLTGSEDDALFTENFQIDEDTGVITQKNPEMVYTKNNKLITTGYLVLHFEGYKEDAVRKYKITIPTQTVKPSYKLDKTTDTYNMTASEQTVVLSVIDSKTKKQVVLDDADWTMELQDNAEGSVSRENISIDSEGRIEMVVNSNPQKGKVVLDVRNDAWAAGQKCRFTYNIKTTSANPKIKLKAATVSLNRRYTEETAEFYLVSNQCDTVLADSQEYTSLAKANNQAEYEKLDVNYSGGVGTVSINDETIRTGSYKFKFGPIASDRGEEFNYVTLTVKVTDTVPALKVKGTPALNLAAAVDGDYTEVAEAKLDVKLPEGYMVDEVETIGSIECTTKGMSDAVEKFDWSIVENVLRVSLTDPLAVKKYAFTMIPVYTSDTGGRVEGKKVKFNVNVYKGTISVKLSAKGTLNLLDREEGREYTLKNSIVYTPSFTNLKDTVEEVQIFDAVPAPQLGDEESRYFMAEVVEGKIYVSPREGVDLENKKTYPVRIWLKLANYGGFDGIWVPGRINVKTAQIIPKVTTDKTSLDLYLSKKGYEETFTVSPKEDSIGKISEVVFGEKDTKSEDSFEINCEQQEDGSLQVRMSLKDTVAYAGNTSSKVTMYVRFEGQGTNTPGTAITMNVRINK